jgi:arylsulfatase A-like enzyme
MKARRKNVILILSDQLRADCVGCYGNTVIRTPHIDTLAAAGVRFGGDLRPAPPVCPQPCRPDDRTVCAR